MTERLTCSNCGGPVSRTGNETRVTCTHCQNVTEFAPLHTSRSSDDDDDMDDEDFDSSRHGHHSPAREVPNIVIIQGDSPTVVRRMSFLPFLIAPIFFIVLSAGISYMHMRAARTAASSVAGAEKAVEKAEKAAEKASEKAAEKKPAGHH